MTDQEISFDDGHAAAGPTTCSRCGIPLAEYWAVDGAVVCERCKDELLAERASPEGRAGRVLKALGLGTGGMIIGATVWYLVGKFTGYEVGLIAILLGFLVGKGIFIGSGKRGGLGYQILAVAITYFGIGAGMAPMAFEQLRQGMEQGADSLARAEKSDTASSPAVTQLSDSALDAELAKLDSAVAGTQDSKTPAIPTALGFAVGIVALVVLILSLPVLSILGGGFIGILIYGFAVFEAFRLTRKVDPVVSGPHPVAAATGG